MVRGGEQMGPTPASHAHGDVLIDVRDVTFRYGDQPVLSGVSASVRAGEVVALMGLNGTGKSTLLKLVGGSLLPESGEITVCGSPPRAWEAPLTRVAAHCDPGAVDPRHTPRRHLSWLCALSGIPVSRVEEVLPMMGLAEVADRPAGRLSLGYRQRVGLAAMELARPACVLLDEPFNGLDVAGIHWLRERIRYWAESEGRCVLLSTHHGEDARRCASRVIVVGSGSILIDAHIPDVCARYGDLERAVMEGGAR
ncbi:ATP-binding cassette domain-containing protein [Corynebacterium uropygiale]|uniref:ATP-binding cassette domain-containing protein n=1 Tax=Corynebacterium uropygiale TaxID=1775911 RepID=A0A9X1TZN9_9CORY|nr:ATP-binding cassette domain-containing protein [Corynebacterium uropygiale]MCF4007116.1 ATP-binding cassette domain-containing protein [Corynebacterium uropygiale]